MIDNLTTLFVTLMALYACVRAIKLDRRLPWFETRSMFEKAKAEQAPVDNRPVGDGTQSVVPGRAIEPWRGTASGNTPYGSAVRATDPRLK